MSILTAGFTILTACSQQQVSVNEEDLLETSEEILPFKAPKKRPSYIGQPTPLEEPPTVENKLVLDPPPRADVVRLAIGRNVFEIDDVPFETELEGGVGHTVCYQERVDSSWLVCK